MGTNVNAPLPPQYFFGELGDSAPDDELLAWLNARYAEEVAQREAIEAIEETLGGAAVMQTTDPRVDFHLHGTTGDDANEGTADSVPLRTFAGIAAKMPKIFGPSTREVFLHAREVIDAPTVDDLAALLFRFQPSTASGPAPVFVLDGGTEVVEVLAPTVSDINAPGEIGLSAATWDVEEGGEWRGVWAEMIDGPLAGQRFEVRGNDATTLRLLDVGPDVVGDPGAGTTFRLVRPATEITAAAAANLEVLLTIQGRADFHLQNLYFSGGAKIAVGLSGADNRAVISHVVHAGGADVDQIASFGRRGTQPCEIAINGHLYDTGETPGPDPIDLGTERLGLSQRANTAKPLENVLQGEDFSVRYSVIPLLIEAFSDRTRILASWTGQYTARHCRLGAFDGHATFGHTAEDGDVPGVPTVVGGYREAGAPAVEVFPAVIAEHSSVAFNKTAVERSTWGIELIKSYAVLRAVSGENATGGIYPHAGSTVHQHRGGGAAVSTLSGPGGAVQISEDGATEISTWADLAAVPVQTPGFVAEDYDPPAQLFPPWAG